MRRALNILWFIVLSVGGLITCAQDAPRQPLVLNAKPVPPIAISLSATALDQAPPVPPLVVAPAAITGVFVASTLSLDSSNAYYSIDSLIQLLNLGSSNTYYITSLANALNLGSSNTYYITSLANALNLGSSNSPYIVSLANALNLGSSNTYYITSLANALNLGSSNSPYIVSLGGLDFGSCIITNTSGGTSLVLTPGNIAFFTSPTVLNYSYNTIGGCAASPALSFTSSVVIARGGLLPLLQHAVAPLYFIPFVKDQFTSQLGLRAWNAWLAEYDTAHPSLPPREARSYSNSLARLRMIGEADAHSQPSSFVRYVSRGYNSLLVVWEFDADPSLLLSVIAQARSAGFSNVVLAASSPERSNSIYACSPTEAATALAQLAAVCDGFVPLWRGAAPIHWGDAQLAMTTLARWLSDVAVTANPQLVLYGIIEGNSAAWAPTGVDNLIVTQLTSGPWNESFRLDYARFATRLRSLYNITGSVVFGPVFVPSVYAPVDDDGVERRLDRLTAAGVGVLRLNGNGHTGDRLTD